MGADLRTTAARVVRPGGLAAVALAAALALAGCGGSTGPDASDLEAENRELRQENGRLEGEVERLQGEVERLQGEVEEARETAGAEPGAPATEPTAQEEEVREAEPEGSSGGGLAVAGPGEVEGERLPEVMPEDFPIPAGGVADYVSEMGYNFSLDFVIDSDFETTTGFYDEQLAERGWEETDRTEGIVEGLRALETSWERGTFIPEGSPNDPDFEQTKETLTLGIYEIEPSGVAVEIFWTDFEILNKNGSDG